MKICGRCGCQNVDDSLFCVNCGNNLQQEYMRTQQVQKRISPLVGVLVVLIVLVVLLVVLLFSVRNTNSKSEKMETQITVENNSNMDVFPPNPIHHCTKEDDDSDYTEWSYIYFGSYPQTKISKESLTSEIVNAPYDVNGDAWVGNVRYRRDDVDGCYYKWEPLKWRVLQNDGSSLFILANQAIECKDYHEEAVGITWEECSLRKWLNNSFYNMAFSSNEKEIVIEQNIVNEDNPYLDTKGGNDTEDYVHLLSLSDVTKSNYGFCEDYKIKSASRKIIFTDYANRECWWHHGSGFGNDSTYLAEWLLRTPGYTSACVANVGFNGYASIEGKDVVKNGWEGHRHIVPAIHIKLDSDLWSVCQ